MATKNDITGDSITSRVSIEKYRANWDKIFSNITPEYNVNDIVYYSIGSDDLQEGLVVNKFVDVGITQYVLRCLPSNGIEFDYVVRTYETLSDSFDQPLNWLKQITPDLKD